MGQLRFFDENDVFRTRNLGGDAFVIGRGDSSQLVIDDDLVSREHSRVEQDSDGRFRVRDLGSRNKTFVNGQQITETLLNDGDMVRIGGHVFEFLDNGAVRELKDLSFLAADRTAPPETQWLKSRSAITLSLARFGQLGVLGADAGYPARAEDVASAALSRLLLLMKADRGFVALRGESKTELRPVAQRGFPATSRTKPKPVSRTFVYSAFVQSASGRYPQKAKSGDEDTGHATAGLVAPLLDRDEVIGVVYVDKPGAGKTFPESALQEIAVAGAHIGALIVDASKRLLASETTVGHAWLTTLRRMQLASTIPPTSNKSFGIAVKLLAGRARCGDFCDVIHVSDNRTFILMIDAGGQGVAGFVQATAIRTAVRSALTIEGGTLDLAAILTSVNRSILARGARELVTCTVLDLDPAGGQVRYVNAGGPSPLLIPGPTRLVTLDQPSLVLGVDAHYNYRATSIDLPAAFRLICHTDGLTEMLNVAGESFGSQRLHDLLLERKAFGTAQDIVASIVEETERHRGETNPDDDALICVVSHG